MSENFRVFSLFCTEQYMTSFQGYGATAPGCSFLATHDPHLTVSWPKSSNRTCNILYICILLSLDQPTQTTPATSCERPLWMPQPLLEQWSIEVSFPTHATFSNKKLLLPEPNFDSRSADLAPLKPVIPTAQQTWSFDILSK